MTTSIRLIVSDTAQQRSTAHLREAKQSAELANLHGEASQEASVALESLNMYLSHEVSCHPGKVQPEDCLTQS